MGQRAVALTTVADLEKRFSKSAWLKDAKALEVEIRQSSGQNPSPESQADEETKLMAMRGVMQADPERGVPMIEKLLSGTSSIKIKELTKSVTLQARGQVIIINLSEADVPWSCRKMPSSGCDLRRPLSRISLAHSCASSVFLPANPGKK